MIVNIFIPRPESPALRTITPGSAIVGQSTSGGLTECYYEGNIHGAENLHLYRERLLVAAGRLASRAPTIARMRIDLNELISTGRYDTERLVIVSLDAPEELCRWSGESIDQIAGRKLEAGKLPWLEAVDLCVGGRAINDRPSSSGTMFYKTIAGQIIELQFTRSAATVYNHDDPTVAALLSSFLPGDALRTILG